MTREHFAGFTNLTWYSVFVGIDDFDFVAEYLQTHCKKARISYI